MSTNDQFIGGAFGGAIAGPAGAAYGYLKGKKRHTSLTFVDPYSGTTQHANTEAEKAAYLEMRKRKQFREKMNTYDQKALKFRDNLTRDFRTTSNYEGAQQAGGVAAATNLEGMRRGLGDEFTGALNSDAQARLRSQVLSSQLSFEQKLGQLMYGERMGFVKGEFDFINRLTAMNYGNELSKDLARFQANLQNDIGMRDILGSIAELGGAAIGGMFGGPTGAAAGGSLAGGAFGQASEYGVG